MRDRKITRTIKITIVEITTLNVETAEVQKFDIKVPSFAVIKHPMEYFQSHYDSETVKVVVFKPLETRDTLFAMDENDFIANATEITSAKEV